MSKETFIFGYISTFSEFDEENSSVLKNFKYDENKFPNIFTEIKQGYGFASSVIGFAMSFDSVTTNSNYWIKCFEELLGKLNAFSASVEIQCDDYPEEEGSFYYVLDSSEKIEGKKSWVKLVYEKSNVLKKEELIELEHD